MLRDDTTPTMQPMKMMHNVSKTEHQRNIRGAQKIKASMNFATEHVLQKRLIVSNTQVTSAIIKKYGVINVSTQQKENERTRVNILVKPLGSNDRASNENLRAIGMSNCFSDLHTTVQNTTTIQDRFAWTCHDGKWIHQTSTFVYGAVRPCWHTKKNVIEQ